MMAWPTATATAPGPVVLQAARASSYTAFKNWRSAAPNGVVEMRLHSNGGSFTLTNCARLSTKSEPTRRRVLFITGTGDWLKMSISPPSVISARLSPGRWWPPRTADCPERHTRTPIMPATMTAAQSDAAPIRVQQIALARRTETSWASMTVRRPQAVWARTSHTPSE
jgi:hypothetical protein